MAKEVHGDLEALRAADADRQRIADLLKEALDEGRLSLHEYDDRVRDAYAARTYKELRLLVADLPRPGLSAAEVEARREAEARKRARRLPTALIVLWTIWASLAVVNLVVFGIVAATVGEDTDLYPWPVWMLVPGGALAVVTLGTQMIRGRQRR